MRESELRAWIEDLAEAQGEKERQRSQQRERERHAVEERRRRRLETVRERCEEEGVDPDFLLTLRGFTEELTEEAEAELEQRREEVIAEGEDVDLPNETAAFTDGVTPRSGGGVHCVPPLLRGDSGERWRTRTHRVSS